MTTLSEHEHVCAVCNDSSTHTVTLSTNELGPPDLDGRPSEMMRSTLEYWVQKCPHCGYCAEDISRSIGAKSDFIESKSYKEYPLKFSKAPAASNFLHLSFILQKLHLYNKAAYQLISAAWSCDDRKLKKDAKRCRKEAIRIIEHADSLSENNTPELVIADLYRRVGFFGKARKIVSKIDTSNLNEFQLMQISYERELIDKHDTESHSISELDEYHSTIDSSSSTYTLVDKNTGKEWTIDDSTDLSKVTQAMLADHPTIQQSNSNQSPKTISTPTTNREREDNTLKNSIALILFGLALLLVSELMS